MNIMRNLLLFLTLISSLTAAGQAFSGEMEKDLQKAFDHIYTLADDKQKLMEADVFLDKFRQSLYKEGAYDYPFDLLKMGKLTSPDDKFRLFNWNLNLKNGKEKYYALVVIKKKNRVEIIQMDDKVDSDKNFETATYSNKKWSGALYYEIIPFKKSGRTSYILLGWDGHNNTSNKKVIEVMNIRGKSVQLGAPVLIKNNKAMKRMGFEYAEDAMMSLKYNEKSKVIIFDHLAPIGNHIESEKEFFAPDLTFDAFKYKKGKWYFIDNFEFLRPKGKSDKDFKDPRQKKRKK